MKKLLFIILLFTAFMCLTTHHLTAADIDKKDVFAVEQSLKAQDWLQIMQIVKKWPNSADEIDVFKRLSKLNSLSDEARFCVSFE